MASVLLGLGANLGDPRAAIEAALVRLSLAGVAIEARSSFYRTAPWGVADQPAFLNLCATACTDLDPLALFAATQAIEAAIGRRPGLRWGPRAIDIDLLDYDGRVLDAPSLTLPHPRLTERAFVLVPLAEIAPDRVIRGRRVADWVSSVDASGVERLDGEGRAIQPPPG